MASPPYLKYAPECSCGTDSVVHSPDCDYRHYIQGYFDGACNFLGKHLRLDFLDGRCARCGRYENGTLVS